MEQTPIKNEGLNKKDQVAEYLKKQIRRIQKIDSDVETSEGRQKEIYSSPEMDQFREEMGDIEDIEKDLKLVEEGDQPTIDFYWKQLEEAKK